MQILCRPFNCFYKLLWTKKINWNVKRKEDTMEVTFLPLFGKTGTLRHHLFYFFLPLDFFFTLSLQNKQYKCCSETFAIIFLVDYLTYTNFTIT